jgi:hypothetical protein
MQMSLLHLHVLTSFENCTELTVIWRFESVGALVT